MTTYARRYPLVAVLLWPSAILNSGARRVRRLAIGIGERLEKRRSDRTALHEQIAIRTRVPASEMERVAFASHPLFNPFRID